MASITRHEAEHIRRQGAKRGNIRYNRDKNGNIVSAETSFGGSSRERIEDAMRNSRTRKVK